MTLDLGVAIRETLAWLDAFDPANAAVAAPRPAPVRVWRSGAEQWQELAEWPPPDAADHDFYLQPGGGLGSDPPAAEDGAASTFRYDPADPTPSIGGRIMSLRSGGSRDNSAVEARADVLTFSTGPLAQPLEVAGVPRVRLYLGSDNAHHDVFVRLCDVDPQGISRNLTDQIVRSVPGQVTPGAAARDHDHADGRRARLPAWSPGPAAGRGRSAPALRPQPGRAAGPRPRHPDGAGHPSGAARRAPSGGPHPARGRRGSGRAGRRDRDWPADRRGLTSGA